MKPKNTFALIPISLFTLFLKAIAQHGQIIDVNTTRGPLFGFHFDQGSNTSKLYYGQADIFLGIPYVLPPIGGLRFAVILDHSIIFGF
jgi:hypothetical protein